MIPDEIPEAPGSVPGHNSGSAFDDARSQQAAALYDTPREGKTFAQRKAEFLASAAAQRVRNRQTAADAADTIKLAGEVWALIDTDRRERTAPFYAVHRDLTGQANEFWAPVVDAMQGLRDQIDAWSDEEDKRVEAQRAEQAAEMASWRTPGSPPPADAPPPRQHIDYAKPAAAAAPKTGVLPPRSRKKIRGDLGATISARQIFDYEVEDVRQLPDHVLNSPVVIDAIIAFVKGTVKYQGVPPGVRAIPRTDNQIR